MLFVFDVVFDGDVVCGFLWCFFEYVLVCELLLCLIGMIVYLMLLYVMSDDDIVWFVQCMCDMFDVMLEDFG